MWGFEINSNQMIKKLTSTTFLFQDSMLEGCKVCLYVIVPYPIKSMFANTNMNRIVFSFARSFFN